MRFDFGRLGFNLSEAAVVAQVDSVPLQGWTFRLLDLSAGQGAEAYVVAIATDQQSSELLLNDSLEVLQLSREEISRMLG